MAGSWVRCEAVISLVPLGMAAGTWLVLGLGVKLLIDNGKSSLELSL